MLAANAVDRGPRRDQRKSVILTSNLYRYLRHRSQDRPFRLLERSPARASGASSVASDEFRSCAPVSSEGSSGHSEPEIEHPDRVSLTLGDSTSPAQPPHASPSQLKSNDAYQIRSPSKSSCYTLWTALCDLGFDSPSTPHPIPGMAPGKSLVTNSAQNLCVGPSACQVAKSSSQFRRSQFSGKGQAENENVPPPPEQPVPPFSSPRESAGGCGDIQDPSLNPRRHDATNCAVKQPQPQTVRGETVPRTLAKDPCLQRRVLSPSPDRLQPRGPTFNSTSGQCLSNPITAGNANPPREIPSPSRMPPQQAPPQIPSQYPTQAWERHMTPEKRDFLLAWVSGQNARLLRRGLPHVFDPRSLIPGHDIEVKGQPEISPPPRGQATSPGGRRWRDKRNNDKHPSASNTSYRRTGSAGWIDTSPGQHQQASQSDPAVANLPHPSPQKPRDGPNTNRPNVRQPRHVLNVKPIQQELGKCEVDVSYATKNITTNCAIWNDYTHFVIRNSDTDVKYLKTDYEKF